MTPRRSTTALLTSIAALALAGCGNQGGGETQAASGEAVFNQAGCANCHTLSAAGSNGTVGPNLDQRKPSAEEVERKVRTGGGQMPSFQGRLSDQQIQAVADYVSRSAGQR